MLYLFCYVLRVKSVVRNRQRNSIQPHLSRTFRTLLKRTRLNVRPNFVISAIKMIYILPTYMSSYLFDQKEKALWLHTIMSMNHWINVLYISVCIYAFNSTYAAATLYAYLYVPNRPTNACIMGKQGKQFSIFHQSILWIIHFRVSESQKQTCSIDETLHFIQWKTNPLKKALTIRWKEVYVVIHLKLPIPILWSIAVKFSPICSSAIDIQ